MRAAVSLTHTSAGWYAPPAYCNGEPEQLLAYSFGRSWCLKYMSKLVPLPAPQSVDQAALYVWLLIWLAVL